MGELLVQNLVQSCNPVLLAPHVDITLVNINNSWVFESRIVNLRVKLVFFCLIQPLQKLIRSDVYIQVRKKIDNVYLLELRYTICICRQHGSKQLKAECVELIRG